MSNYSDSLWISLLAATRDFSGSLGNLPVNAKGSSVQNQGAQAAALYALETSRPFTAIHLVPDEDLQQFIGQVAQATSAYLRILRGGGFNRRFLGSSTERKADAALSALRSMVARMQADLRERPARYRLMKQTAMQRAREGVLQADELLALRPQFVKDPAFAFCLASTLARTNPGLITEHIGSFSLTDDEKAEIFFLVQNPSMNAPERDDFSYGYALALIAQGDSRPNTATRMTAVTIQNSHRPDRGISLPSSISLDVVFRHKASFQGILGRAASYLGYSSIDELQQAWRIGRIVQPECLKAVIHDIIREWMEHSDRGNFIPVNCESLILEVKRLLAILSVRFNTVYVLPLVTERTLEFSNLLRKPPVCEGDPLTKISSRLQASTEKQFVLELYRRHRPLGHSIHVSLEPPSFCDTSDVNGLTGLPRMREFTSKEEMIQYLQNYVDLMYSGAYERFTLTPYQRVFVPEEVPPTPAPILPISAESRTVLPSLPLHFQQREPSQSESGLLKAAVFVGIALVAKYFFW